MVLHCQLEAKEMLMERAPDIYFQTDHFKGWPGLLVRLDVITDEELSLRLEDAWRFKAPKKLATQHPTTKRNEDRPTQQPVPADPAAPGLHDDHDARGAQHHAGACRLLVGQSRDRQCAGIRAGGRSEGRVWHRDHQGE